MKIAFLMDELERIRPLDETGSYLMYECNQRGHTVFFVEPHDLYVRGKKVLARMRNVTFETNLSMEEYRQRLIECLKQDQLIFESMTDLDALFLRKNPLLPYQTMEFLAPVNDQVFVINSPDGQVLGNSKMYPLNFPDIIPETHVSKDPNRLKRIIDDFGGAMIVKPLQRFGGEGVIKVSTKDQENLISLINYYVRAFRPYPEREPIMIQEYLDKVKSDGDVRILLLNGEILGAMKRVPRQGDFRTNIHAGATASKHQITDGEAKICSAIKEKLIRDGLFFVGIDVIGDKLVEISCVSPGGIPRINRLNHTKLEAKVVDFIEYKVGERKRDSRAEMIL